jgi:GAF domain-containing protein
MMFGLIHFPATAAQVDTSPSHAQERRQILLDAAGRNGLAGNCNGAARRCQFALVADEAIVGRIRTMLGVPLMREGMPIGTITLMRHEVRAFKQIDLFTTFADQAVIAIENVRLFDEVQDKNRQLQLASENKSQVVSSMSHELRTPLNAIIGLTEMMVKIPAPARWG